MEAVGERCKREGIYVYLQLIRTAVQQNLTLRYKVIILQLKNIFFKFALAIWGLLCFYTNCKNFCPNSVKNANGNLIEIALNLKLVWLFSQY